MKYKQEILLILNNLVDDEEKMRIKLVETILNNRSIVEDFNIVTIIEELKYMNLKQCESLEKLKTQLQSNTLIDDFENDIYHDAELLIMNNIIENLNCDVLNDLAICEDLFIESPKKFKNEIINKYGFNSNIPSLIELDLILTSKKLFGRYNKNYKKLIKERSKK